MLDGWVALGFGGGGGGGALGSTVVGTIDGGLPGGSTEGARVAGGGIGAALDAGGGGADVVVTGTVGRTTPVKPNGCRDTTVIADNTTPTATAPRTLVVTGTNQFVQDSGSRCGTLTWGATSLPFGSPRSSRGHSTS